MRVKCNSCQAAVINGRASHESGCKGHFVLTDDKGIKYKLFQSWFVECWGNARDGFEMNDRAKGPQVALPVECDDKVILRRLRKAEIMGSSNFARYKRLRFNWQDENTCYIDKINGKQLLQLEAL